MRQLGFGTSASENIPWNEIPEDRVCFAELCAWIVEVSDATGRVYIRSTDYHPGVLEMTKEDLMEILARLGKGADT